MTGLQIAVHGFRYPGLTERSTSTGDAFESPRRLDEVLNLMTRQADFKGPMKINYKSQHFTRDCLRGLTNVQRVLHNQNVFDVVERHFPVKPSDP